MVVLVTCRQLLGAGIILCYLLFTMSCTSNYQKVVILPVAKVNEHTLDVKMFSILLARELKDLDALSAKDPNNTKRVKENILNNFVEESLREDWAQKNNIAVNSNDLDKKIKEIRSTYPDDLSFRRYLAESNLSFSEWRDGIEKTLLSHLVFQKLNQEISPPTESDIKQSYSANLNRFKVKEQIFISQIVVTEELAAEEILKIIKSKEFSSLAKKYSVFPEGKTGGEVGWIERGSVDFFDPLFSLPIGIHNKIIKSPFGYHIVNIQKKSSPGTRPLEEVRNQIIRELRAKKEQAVYLKWLDIQLRNSKVYKNYELINSINPATKGTNE